MVRRKHCWKRKSSLSENYDEIMRKWIIENGIPVIRKRVISTGTMNDFGYPDSEPIWDVIDLYVVVRELSEIDNQTEFGHNPYKKKDKLKVQTSSLYDVRKNDIIEISTEYPLVYDYDDIDAEFTYWKIAKRTCMSFDLGSPSAPMLYLERVYSSDMIKGE